MGIKHEESIRRNLLIPKSMYLQSSEIAKNLGLTYSDYIRMLIVLDIRAENEIKLIDFQISQFNNSKELKNLFIRNFNPLVWSTKSSRVKNGHSWKAMSTF